MPLIDDIQIGDHQVLWTPDGGTEIDLGHTEEGVVIDVAGESYKITVHGISAPIGAVHDTLSITSEILLVKCNTANIAAGLGALLTTVAGPPAAVSVDISPIQGEPLDFGKLVFHPRKLIPTDKSKDVTMWKAMVERQGSFIFKANDKGLVQFNVEAAAVEDGAGEWKILTFGDPSTAVTFPI